MGWKEPVYVAKVESIKKSCGAGHEVGDTFEINTHKTGGSAAGATTICSPL